MLNEGLLDPLLLLHAPKLNIPPTDDFVVVAFSSTEVTFETVPSGNGAPPSFDLTVANVVRPVSTEKMEDAARLARLATDATSMLPWPACGIKSNIVIGFILFCCVR